MVRDPRSSIGFRPAAKPRTDNEVLAQRVELFKEHVVSAFEALERHAIAAFLGLRQLLRTLPDRRAIRVLYRALRPILGRKGDDLICIGVIAFSVAYFGVRILEWRLRG